MLQREIHESCDKLLTSPNDWMYLTCSGTSSSGEDMVVGRKVFPIEFISKSGSAVEAVAKHAQTTHLIDASIDVDDRL